MCKCTDKAYSVSALSGQQKCIVFTWSMFTYTDCSGMMIGLISLFCTSLVARIKYLLTLVFLFFLVPQASGKEQTNYYAFTLYMIETAT